MLPEPLDPKLHPPLPLHIGYGLNILFCGINPGQRSSQSGHHFAHPTNQFWRVMSESRLSHGVVMRHQDDKSYVESHGYGFTNIAARPSVQAQHLHSSEMVAGSLQLIQRIKDYRPRFVCFIGRQAHQYFCKTITKYETECRFIPIASETKDGLQGYIEGETWRTAIFAIPSTSGRCRVPYAVKLDLLNELSDLVQSSSAGFDFDKYFTTTTVK
jgi:TDG/mug DNA glycosylase family protein